MFVSRLGLPVMAALMLLVSSSATAGIIVFDSDLSGATNNGGIATNDPTITANFQFVGNVTTDAVNDTVTLTADGGREQFGISTNAGIEFGRIIVELNSTFNPANQNFFFELGDGPSRNTMGNPTSRFSGSINQNAVVVAAGTGPLTFSTVEFLFNTTGTSETATLSDGSTTVTVGPTSALLFVDGVARTIGANNPTLTESAGPIGDIDSIFFQSFNGQIGGTHVFNRVVLEDLAPVPVAVPEPTSVALLFGAAIGLCGLRRRR